MPIPASAPDPTMMGQGVAFQSFSPQAFAPFMSPYAPINGYYPHTCSQSAHYQQPASAFGGSQGYAAPIQPSLVQGGSPVPATPPTGPVAAPSAPATRPGTFGFRTPQCRWEIEVAQQQSPVMRMLDLTWLDKYFHDRNSPSQVIGFRFSHSLDQQKLSQALKLAVDEYPVIGSKVVLHQGQTKFQLDEERLLVHLVHVTPEVLGSMNRLVQLCDILCPRSADQKQNALFHAFLFKTSNSKHGSVLICGFQHCIGDAMSYAMFMHKWSECYEQLAAATRKSSKEEPLPAEPFSNLSAFDPSYKINPLGPVLHSFFFSEAALSSVKQQVLQACGKGQVLSTNDVLCAQCAVAIAPFRFRHSGADASSEVRIVMLVDFRGLSVPKGTWGNRWADIAVDMPWSELLGGNVAAVARRIRAKMVEQTGWMAHDCERFNRERAARPQVAKLFTWNSWAKAGELLRQTHFRELKEAKGLRELSWFNASWLPITDGVVVEPLAAVKKSDPVVVVRVASPRGDAEGEGQSLKRCWAVARMEERR